MKPSPKKSKNFLAWLFSDMTIMKGILIMTVVAAIIWGVSILFTTMNYDVRLALEDLARWEIWVAIIGFILAMIGLVLFIRDRSKK